VRRLQHERTASQEESGAWKPQPPDERVRAERLSHGPRGLDSRILMFVHRAFASDHAERGAQQMQCTRCCIVHHALRDEERNVQSWIVPDA
jgi:hypothetical protein